MFSIGLLFLASHCLFTPPQKWEIADPKMPSKRALVGFIDKSKSGFCPSLNLTHERVFVSMEEYLSVVEKNCRAKKQYWKHLGQLQTKGGLAELAEIEVKTKFGPARLLQALLKRGEDVYILTAGSLKKDFGKNAKVFEGAFRSMVLCEDLFALVKEEEVRIALKEAWQKKESGVKSVSFEKMVLERKDLGPVWQMLMLKL